MILDRFATLCVGARNRLPLTRTSYQMLIGPQLVHWDMSLTTSGIDFALYGNLSEYLGA